MTEQESSKELAELAVIGDDRAAEVARFKAATAEELAGFEQWKAENRALAEENGIEIGEPPNIAHTFSCWLELYEQEALEAKLAALGVPPGDHASEFCKHGQDAHYLAMVSPETRARLQFDGKPLP